jgi:hypothetical protein
MQTPTFTACFPAGALTALGAVVAGALAPDEEVGAGWGVGTLPAGALLPPQALRPIVNNIRTVSKILILFNLESIILLPPFLPIH